MKVRQRQLVYYFLPFFMGELDESTEEPTQQPVPQWAQWIRDTRHSSKQSSHRDGN
ncbi:MAG: hypothetical protein JXR76_00095 [Deltaproteobacteria bacterium]|nr:hypothetical protein [Deltaproteobacteria bacterium]